MSEEAASILSHVSVGTNDADRATAFYDAVMPVLGCRRMLEHPGAVSYGRAFPEFWVQVPADGAAAAPGNGTHVAFLAPDRQTVDAFHTTALAAGATDASAPAQYGEPYYGCFVRDPDGNKIEAMFWDGPPP